MEGLSYTEVQATDLSEKKASSARCNPFANPPKRNDVRTTRQTLNGLGQRYPATQGPKSLSTNGGANRFER